jgi:putative Mg2+ transporter-C (MgtC) family protein
MEILATYIDWKPYYSSILVHLLVATLVGGLIGLERTMHGRPAGFRTHTLVCLSSSLLMLLTVYQVQLLPHIPIETIRIDPTRMGQGIMTGIGFLGAGVIMKEGLTVRGLTTAASIWITASIGILVGVGFYFAAFVSTLLALGALSIFRAIEAVMPSTYYGNLLVRSQRKDSITENELCEAVKGHAFCYSNTSYKMLENGKVLEYQVTLWTKDRNNFHLLARDLTKIDKVSEFELSPIGN